MEAIIQIDSESKVPLYHQLKEQIKKSILNGIFKEGDLIPSEREWNERYGLSSTTVRRALNDLVHENFLERKAGKGTFVRMKKIKRDLKKVLSFTDNMREMGLTPSTKVIDKNIVPATEAIHQRMNVEKGIQILKLRRLRLANDIPMMLETRYIRLDLCPKIDKEDLTSSLWKIFENQYGLKPNRHLQNLTIVKISGKSASLLELKNNTAVFFFKGVTYVRNDQAIECEDSFYRSDKYDLTLEATL